MSEAVCDVAIIGSGGNGLTAAAYLARAGARVIAFEQRFERGGTLASDDYSTPFLYNQGQLLVPFGEELPPYRDLDLADHAVAFIRPPLAFTAAVSGDRLIIERGGRGLGNEIQATIERASSLAMRLCYEPATRAAAFADEDGVHADLLALATATPRTLSSATNDDRAAMIVRYACGLVGFYDPDEPLGVMGACALARVFEPVLVAGGTKSLANGLFRAAARAGARCLVSTPVVRVDRNAEDLSVQLADGRRFRARAVISTLDPRTTFGSLVGPYASDELRNVAERWQLEPSGSFTAHFGIKGTAPSVSETSAEDAVVRMVGFSTPEEVTAHFQAVAEGQVPDRPAGHLTVTTNHDPLQASAGPYGPLNTIRFETLAPYEYRSADSDRARIEYRRSCWQLAGTEIKGLDQVQLLFQFADSPRDLERRFATTRNGSLRHGSLRSQQTLVNRPHLSCVDGRTPIKGLFLGGGGTHPGVPGALAGGYHAAAAVCSDLEIDRWWPEPTLDTTGMEKSIAHC